MSSYSFIIQMTESLELEMDVNGYDEGDRKYDGENHISRDP
jgi:hypothetical protein